MERDVEGLIGVLEVTKYVPYVYIDGRVKRLGEYATAKGAVLAHDRFEMELHGANAVTNGDLSFLDSE